MNVTNSLRTSFHRLRTQPKSKNLILTGIVVVSASLLTAIVSLAPEPDKKPVTETTWPVTALEAAPGSIAPELQLYGRVETPWQASLTPAISAFVASVPARDGQWVKQGDVLVELDAIDAELNLQRSEANVEEARANLKTLRLTLAENERNLKNELALKLLAEQRATRHEQLSRQQSISEDTLNTVLADANRQAISYSHQQHLVDDAENQLARAQSQLKRAEAGLAEARLNLTRTRLVAPFDGRVTHVSVSPGERVSPGQPIVQMYDTTRMEIRSQIPARELVLIKAAMANGVQLQATVLSDGDALPANLDRLSGAVTTGRSSVDGLFTLNQSTNLELGRTVNLLLTLPSVPNAVLVPVQSMYGNERVFIVQDDRLVGINVERLGERRGQDGHLNVLIRSNQLTPGTPIVTSQLSNAITGLRVLADTAATDAPIDTTTEARALARH